LRSSPSLVDLDRDDRLLPRDRGWFGDGASPSSFSLRWAPVPLHAPS
jgi:hypothetical protein